MLYFQLNRLFCLQTYPNGFLMIYFYPKNFPFPKNDGIQGTFQNKKACFNLSLKHIENDQFSINEIHVNKFIAVIILTKTI